MTVRDQDTTHVMTDAELALAEMGVSVIEVDALRGTDDLATLTRRPRAVFIVKDELDAGQVSRVHAEAVKRLTAEEATFTACAPVTAMCTRCGAGSPAVIDAEYVKELRQTGHGEEWVARRAVTNLTRSWVNGWVLRIGVPEDELLCPPCLAAEAAECARRSPCPAWCADCEGHDPDSGSFHHVHAWGSSFSTYRVARVEQRVDLDGTVELLSHVEDFHDLDAAGVRELALVLTEMVALMEQCGLVPTPES